MEPGEPLTEREIIAILDSYQEAAISTRSSRLSRERGQALEYYNMEPYGDETKTGSKVVTSEVFDTVETIATRLVKVFTSTDKAVEFVPDRQTNGGARHDRREGKGVGPTGDLVSWDFSGGFRRRLPWAAPARGRHLGRRESRPSSPRRGTPTQPTPSL